MTELSAFAGSEGYAACDDEAQRRSPSAARGRGDFIVKKAVEAFLTASGRAGRALPLCICQPYTLCICQPYTLANQLIKPLMLTGNWANSSSSQAV